MACERRVQKHEDYLGSEIWRCRGGQAEAPHNFHNWSNLTRDWDSYGRESDDVEFLGQLGQLSQEIQ